MDRRTFIGSVTAAALMSRVGWAASERLALRRLGWSFTPCATRWTRILRGRWRRWPRLDTPKSSLRDTLAMFRNSIRRPIARGRFLTPTVCLRRAAHIPYSALSPEIWPKVLDACKVLGHDYIVNPSIDREVLKQPDGWKRAAETFNRAGEESQKVGIQFAYHNHVEEFKPLPDGKLPYDVLLSESDPKLVKMEMDLGWAHEARVDPLKYFAQYPGRFPLVHVKDFDKNDTMTEVGSGVIDWKSIFAQSELAWHQALLCRARQSDAAVREH